MPVLRLLDLEDERLSRFRNVSDAALLETHGLFVAEGRLVVERVVRDGRHRVEQVLLSQSAYDRLQGTLERRYEIEVFVVERPSAFQAITGFDIHRGCLALVRRPAPTAWGTVLAGVRLAVALEAVASADNVGSVFRNAAAFGAGAVLLSPTCCDPLYRKAVRTSMAASTRVPFARIADWPGALHRIRADGFVIAALSPRHPAQSLDAFVETVRGARVLLMVGSEGAGLTPDAEHAADVRVRIPIRDEVDSVNLGVASGIALSRLSSLA